MAYCGVGGTDFDMLGLSAKHAYYGGALFLSLVQRLNAVISLTKIPQTGQQSRAIGTWLRAVERIGQESVYGAVYSGKIGDIADAVVIKMNKDPKRSAELRDEFEIQAHLNALRAFCPNFVLALGAFACAQLRSDVKRIDAPMCSGNGASVDYIIIERIESVPGVVPGAPGQSWTLGQYLELPRIDMDVVHAMFAQVMLALHVAQRQLRFTHYDVHLNNVMLQGLHQLSDVVDTGATNRAVVTYVLENGSISVRTEFLAVIIDFGLSRLTDPETGQRVGGTTIRKGGITPFFSAAYDPYMFVANLDNTLQKRGIRDYAPLYRYVRSMEQYPSEDYRGVRLGLDPAGRPDAARGLTPSSTFIRAMQLMPAFERVINVAAPADVRLPVDLSSWEAYFDCGFAG